ncbi:hypothetical protein Peur_007605 [Populus x canadensis]
MMYYSAWSGDSTFVSLIGSGHMGGGSGQGSGWTWVDTDAIGQFQKGEVGVQPSPTKAPPPPPPPEAAQEALPQALAPAEVVHPIPNKRRLRH